MTGFHPFINERECLQISGVTIENRLDRILLFGFIDLTRDQAGLHRARELKDVLDLVVAAMESTRLPETISVSATDTIKNPFQ